MRTFIFTTMLALSANLSLANTFNITSSDLLEGYIEDTISAYAKQENKELNMKFEGSMNAINSLRKGDYDMAIVAVPKNLEYKLEGLRKYQIAYQTVVVSVNETNIVEELSLEDLKAIYFNTGTKYAKIWADFGTENMSVVQPVSTSTEDNLVVNLFKYTLSPRQDFADWVSVIPEKTRMEAFVKGTNSSIAISGRPLVGVKVVPIISPVTTFPVFPSGESLHSGEYPINLTFYLIFEEKNIAKIKEYAKFLLGKRVSDAFENAGFFTAPEVFRKKFIFDLDISQ